MQRAQRRRVAKRQRNEEPSEDSNMEAEGALSEPDESLECQEGDYNMALAHTPQRVRVDRQGSDASASTTGPQMPPSSGANAISLVSELWNIYIGNSHCPVDGWFQACRVCNSWTSAEFMVNGKLIPLCKGCQIKCIKSCAKDGMSHLDHEAATIAALLNLDRAWEDYLNKLRMENG